jgi:hypothetical protein
MKNINMKTTLIVIAVIILLLCGIFGSGYYFGYKSSGKLPPIIQTKIDTVTISLRDTITFTKPGKIVTTSVRDTFFILAGDTTKPDTLVITERPNIVSCLDTILPRAKGFDTLQVCYRYPENLFDYKLKGTTDYIQISNTTNTMANTKKTISPWWYFGGGTAVGILTTILIMKAIK